MSVRAQPYERKLVARAAKGVVPGLWDVILVSGDVIEGEWRDLTVGQLGSLANQRGVPLEQVFTLAGDAVER